MAKLRKKTKPIALPFDQKWALFQIINFLVKDQAYSLTFWPKMGTFSDHKFFRKKPSQLSYFLAKNGHFFK